MDDLNQISIWLRSILEKCIACSRDVQLPFLPPAYVSFHLIFQLNHWYSEAFGKASGKGVVIVPLNELQVEGVAADHVGNGREGDDHSDLIGHFRGWPVRLGISVEPSQSGQETCSVVFFSV